MKDFLILPTFEVAEPKPPRFLYIVRAPNIELFYVDYLKNIFNLYCILSQTKKELFCK